MNDTWQGLVGALAGTPSLPGAKCRGRPHLFDESGPDEDETVVAARYSQALSLCQRCPALDTCERWFLALQPRKRPTGIVAGRINRTPTRRDRTLH